MPCARQGRGLHPIPGLGGSASFATIADNLSGIVLLSAAYDPIPGVLPIAVGRA
jgi:hypothetical protein